MSDLTEADVADIKGIEVMDELERRLTNFFTVPVYRGWIHLYLKNVNEWPIITLESNSSDGSFPASGKSKQDENIRVRATIEVSPNDPLDPDSQLRYYLHHFRKLIFNEPMAGHQLTTPEGKQLVIKGIKEATPAQFTLPEPGLPFASVHVSLELSFMQSMK